MHPAWGVVFAYVAGSFPSAYLAGRVVKGIDLRTVGSGNLGATNVLRTAGPVAAVVVLLLDAAKGGLPVYFLPIVLGTGEPASGPGAWWAVAYGVAAVVGHAKPVFLLWRGGGKGVATSAGVFAVLAPVPLTVTLVVVALVVWRTGYMSIGSIVAAFVLPSLVAVTQGPGPVLWACLLIAVFVLWSHRANYARLRAGTEGRVFGGKPTTGRSP